MKFAVMVMTISDVTLYLIFNYNGNSSLGRDLSKLTPFTLY